MTGKRIVTCYLTLLCFTTYSILGREYFRSQIIPSVILRNLMIFYPSRRENTVGIFSLSLCLIPKIISYPTFSFFLQNELGGPDDYYSRVPIPISPF